MNVPGFRGRYTKVVLCAFVLALFLFGGSPALQSGPVGFLFQGISACSRDRQTQWLAYSLIAAYGVFLLVLRFRHSGKRLWRVDNPGLWFAGFMVIASAQFAVSYPTPVEPVRMMAGVVLGQAVAVLALSAARRDQTKELLRDLTGVLLLLVCVGALWHAGVGRQFQYRGRERWVGQWENPNFFGLLMAAGLVLAAGRLLVAWRTADSGKSDAAKWTRRTVLETAVFGAAAFVLTLGLVKSLSRGAWLAAAIGFWYLGHHLLTRERLRSRAGRWLYEHATSLAIIALAAFTLVFWNYRQTEHHVARRVLSVGNRNDFSWRNRVSAWEGALQIAADRPWRGAGWRRPVMLYDRYYSAPRVVDPSAIDSNDYLMVAAALGLPALACFLACVWLQLKPRAAPAAASALPQVEAAPRDSETDWLKMICRAGAVVLLVGFWFDGGLLQLPIAVTFWVLLEAGARND